jgi:hypothetical protein
MHDAPSPQVVITGTIRREMPCGWLVLPRGSQEPLWLPRRLTQIGDRDDLGYQQFSVPRWFARTKKLAA